MLIGNSIVYNMEPLLSQRHVSFNHCPRPKVNNNQNGLILRQKTSVRPVVHIPTQPFRFMDLPIEIQRLVFELLFGEWEVTLDHERISMLRSTFHVQGVPSMNVLLTSRAIYHQARDIRMNAFNGRLRLNSVFLLVSLKRRENFRWLRDNVRILHFSDSSVHPERWNRYYDNFPNLQRLEIDFPYVLSLDARCFALDQLLIGQHDHVLLETLDAFKLSMVDQLSGMVQVIVSQRYCLKESVNGWKGVVDVQIEFGQCGIRVVKRTHDGDVNVVTKQQFRRPYEL